MFVWPSKTTKISQVDLNKLEEERAAGSRILQKADRKSSAAAGITQDYLALSFALVRVAQYPIERLSAVRFG
jgi:hypothetical protein